MLTTKDNNLEPAFCRVLSPEKEHTILQILAANLKGEYKED